MTNPILFAVPVFIAAMALEWWLGAGQRLVRFVRRHRLPVALGSALALALAVGVGGVVWQAQEARAQARRAEAVKDFLLGVFSAADPRLAGGKPDGQTTAKTLLDRSAARIRHCREVAIPGPVRHPQLPLPVAG